MTILTIDHVNIRTTDLAGTIRFFIDVLEMQHQPPPGMADENSGTWLLDLEGRPVIHVGTAATPYPSDDAFPYSGGQNSGNLHHVAFRCDDFETVRGRLERGGYRFSENLVETIGLRQLFVKECNGILLELNFFED